MADNCYSQPGISELEEMMRREFFDKSLPPKNEHTEEEDYEHTENSSPSSKFLAELEELMREEFFSIVPLISQSQSQSSSRYVYRKLKSENHIRLFYLQPGSHNDKIEGRMAEASIDSKPYFEALSYAWGRSVMPYQILVSDGMISITSSLKSALIRLRYLDRARVLWVDALCINQHDTDEKTQQVLLMSKIYSFASKVVVHLGDKANGSFSALKLIRKIGKANLTGMKNTDVPRSSLKLFGLPSAGDVVWNQFRAFWRRPWFTRVWVIQEFVLGQNVRVICGDWEGDWKFFLEASAKIVDLGFIYRSITFNHQLEGFNKAAIGATAMFRLCKLRVQKDQRKFIQNELKTFLEVEDSILRQPKYFNASLDTFMSLARRNPLIANVLSKELDADNFDACCKFFGLPQLHSGPTLFQGLPLITLLELTKFSEASDPRDHMIALLGLASDLDDEERVVLRPNYNMDPKEVLCKYASVLVQKSHCMELLYRCSIRENCSQMPSWTPNWTIAADFEDPKVPLGSFREVFYRAAGNSEPQARMGNESDVLLIAGGLVDTIDRVAKSPIISQNSMTTMMVNSNLAEADSIMDTLSSYPTGELLSEVKWRTFIANKTKFMAEAPEEYGIQYNTWREYLKGGFPLDLSSPSSVDYQQAVGALLNYKLCKTRLGYIGLVPVSAVIGDQIAIFCGGAVPFVLRKSLERKGMFRLIGGCYIHGWMKGEALGFSHWLQQDISLY